MGEFDYDRPVAPIEKEVFTLEQLFGNLSPVNNDPTNFRGAIYSEPGKGKTFAGIELAQRITPPDKVIIYIYTGTNWDSFKDIPALTQRVFKKPYTSMDELEAFVKSFHNPEIKAKVPVGTIIFDEHNTMFDEDTDRITTLNSVLMKKEKRSYKDPHTPEWPDRNMAKYHLKNIMDETLRLTDINFIFLTHERDGKDSKKKEPDYFNKASQEFMRPLSCLYRLTAEVRDGIVIRTFQTQGTDQVTAKNRITGLPPFVTGPDAVEQIANAFTAWSAANLAGSTAENTPVEEPPATQELPPVSEQKTESVLSPEAEAEVPSQDQSEEEDELRTLLGL